MAMKMLAWPKLSPSLPLWPSEARASLTMRLLAAAAGAVMTGASLEVIPVIMMMGADRILGRTSNHLISVTLLRGNRISTRMSMSNRLIPVYMASIPPTGRIPQREDSQKEFAPPLARETA